MEGTWMESRAKAVCIGPATALLAGAEGLAKAGSGKGGTCSRAVNAVSVLRTGVILRAARAGGRAACRM